MDNSLEILNTLEGTIDRLKVIYSEGGRAALNDNVAEVRQLCISVEEVLRHQQKEKVNFWGERRDYWHYLSEVVSKMKTLDGCVKRVQGLPQLTSAQGKGRALIRECLTEQLLAECIQNSLSNVKRTKDWYLAHSILNTDSLSQRVLNALYDLSDVTFDLPSDGLDLDETWPSFVLKSFQHRNGTTDIQKQNTTMSPILKVLGGSTQVAKVADRDRLKVSKLEHAVEEEATEIYVRHEIPFNLELVGTLLSDIHQDLTTCGTQGDHSPFFQSNKPLPQLQVTKMDDITSCLALLKDYITSWSHDIYKKGGKLIDENKSLRDKQADLEMQLQETILESESSETGLVEQLQASREELKSVSSDLQRLTEENQRLTTELSHTREKVQELEVANFDLEEQLVRCSSSASEAEGEKERQRAFTIMETSLQEKDQELTEITHRLAEAESVREQLQRDLSDAHTSLDNQRLVYESRQKSEERIEQLQSELTDKNAQEAWLRAELAEAQSKNQTLAKELDTVRAEMECEIQEKLEQESAKLASVEAERDHMKAELAEVSTLIEDSTSALKFKLSSQTIELQQVKEQSSKKDRTLAELHGQVRNLESQLGEVTERCESSEQQVEELKRELQDVESVLQDNRDEMSSMHQQLTEKTVSRDIERESMLKSQLAWDSVREQLLKDKIGLKQQLERLTSENDEIRRALQKLLEQKVTLWQHADDLEQEQVAMGMWLDSKVITECMNCNLTFTLFARKHHCRSCGKVFCTKCCEKKIQLAVSKDPSRVCESCYKRIVQKRMPFAASVINNMDSVALLSGVVSPASQPHPQKSGSATPTHLAPSSGPSTGRTSPARNVSSNSLNIERTIDWSGNSLQAKLLVQNQDSDLDSQNQSRNSPVPTTLQSESNTSLTATLRVPYQAPPTETSPAEAEGLEDSDIPPSSYKSVNSMEYSVDPESMRRENERAELESKQRGGGTGTDLLSDSNTNFSISSVPGETIDESYYLIETTPHKHEGDPLLGGGEGTFPVGLNNPGSTSLDVNALASKLASLEGYGASQSEGVVASDRRLSTDSAGRVGCMDVTEVMMEGGGVHKVPVKVEQHGTSIAWEFSTEPKGIAFGIYYRESRTSTKEDEVLPLKRCVSHKATLTGEYCAQKKGVYILKFDNCHSKYSGRKLLYKVWTKPPT